MLKVMRLRTPAPDGPPAIPSLPGALLGPNLLLPMALTPSLVGEAFTGYLHLFNTSATAISDVVMTVELALGLSKTVLFTNSNSPIKTINPGEFLDPVVEHVLKDTGMYALTCTVHYRLPGVQEQSLFKRSYRFEAKPPFLISHRVVQVDRKLLVELTMENDTSSGVCLTSCSLDVVSGHQASVLSGNISEEGVGARLVQPRGSYCMVFQVLPISDLANGALVKALEQVGSVTIGWRIPGGSHGKVEGHQIKVKPVPVSGLDLCVLKSPGEVKVEVPFRIDLQVVNRTNREMNPRLNLDVRLMGPVRLLGAAQQEVGRLQTLGSKLLHLDLLVTIPGLHPLQGLSLSDSMSQTKSEFGVLCEIVAF